LAGLQNSNHSVEFRRLVITDKGCGFGRAAVKLVKKLAFEKMQAHRLWLDVKTQNCRARRLYESEGFVVEGILRECLKSEAGFDSLVVMSMLRNEYRNADGRLHNLKEYFPMQKVNLREKFNLFTEYWRPKIAGELNGQYVKLVKLKGEFIWHQHEAEDELFLVVKGQLCLQLRDREVWLDEGEFFIVPKGVEHKPVAENEVHVLLFEPMSTLNTGDKRNERAVEKLERI
jgi:mannose-6-phosphate isomerase-like protein (cupin superfamily)